MRCAGVSKVQPLLTLQNLKFIPNDQFGYGVKTRSIEDASALISHTEMAANCPINCTSVATVGTGFNTTGIAVACDSTPGFVTDQSANWIVSVYTSSHIALNIQLCICVQNIRRLILSACLSMFVAVNICSVLQFTENLIISNNKSPSAVISLCQ
jgi:hypothetical protein